MRRRTPARCSRRSGAAHVFSSIDALAAPVALSFSASSGRRAPSAMGEDVVAKGPLTFQVAQQCAGQRHARRCFAMGSPCRPHPARSWSTSPSDAGGLSRRDAVPVHQVSRRCRGSCRIRSTSLDGPRSADRSRSPSQPPTQVDCALQQWTCDRLAHREQSALARRARCRRRGRRHAVAAAIRARRHRRPRGRSSRSSMPARKALRTTTV